MSAGFIVQLFELKRPAGTVMEAVLAGLLDRQQITEHMLGVAADARATVDPMCHLTMLRTQEQLALLPVHLVDQALAALSAGRGVVIATVEATRPDQPVNSAGTISDGPASEGGHASGPTP